MIDQGLTLGIILTAGGAVAAAALITGVIQLVKSLFGANWPGGSASRGLAFVLSIVIVVWAYVGEAIALTAATGFAGFLAIYGIARLAMAVYDDATAKVGGLRGPTGTSFYEVGAPAVEAPARPSAILPLSE